MNLGRLPDPPKPPKLPDVPAAPAVPTNVQTNLSSGPLGGAVGVGVPQSFDPNNPSVHVEGTIHNPTGIGGDLKVDRDVKIPTKAPDLDIPSMGGGLSGAGSGGGFGLPDIGNPLSGLSMPSLGRPLESLSGPTLPNFGGFPEYPAFPSIGTPGMPGFRFTNIPEFKFPTPDLSLCDINIPSPIPDFDFPVFDGPSPVSDYFEVDDMTDIVVSVTIEGKGVPAVAYQLEDDDDQTYPGKLDAEGKANLRINGGDFHFEFTDFQDLQSRAWAVDLEAALQAKDVAHLAAWATVGGPSLLKALKQTKTSMDAAIVGSKLADFVTLGLWTSELGRPANYYPFASRPAPTVIQSKFMVAAHRSETAFRSTEAIHLSLQPTSGSKLDQVALPGKWCALFIPRTNPQTSRLIEGPSGMEWKDFHPEGPGLVRVLWKHSSTQEGYFLDLRIVDGIDPTLQLPLRPGKMEDPAWSLGAMLRYRDIVHHLSEEFPVDSKRKAQEQAEWNTLTNLCQSLDVCVQDPFRKLSDADQLALAFQIGQIQAGLDEDPLSAIAWSRLFTTSEPSQVRLSPTVPWMRPDAFLVAWHLIALDGAKEPVWTRGAKVRHPNGEGRFFGAVHLAQIEGIIVPDRIFDEAHRIISSDGKTSCQKLSELLGLVVGCFNGTKIGTLSLRGDRSDLDKVVRKTGMFSFDKKVKDGLDALADEDETLDWRGTITVDGETGKDYDVEVRTVLGEGDPLGWSREVVPLPKRGIGGRRKVRLKNGLCEAMIGVSGRCTFPTGAVLDFVVDSDGCLELVVEDGLYKLEYQTSDHQIYTDYFYLKFDPVETASGKWQRLVNLGNIENPKANLVAKENWLDAGIVSACCAFGVDPCDQEQVAKFFSEIH
ncbi:MAG TPA: hypothetical protein PKO15_17775 [Fibrobacteria bacterium]|mgnify:CR=1 FL=1|nr:hypothetical protein [Fibrobacteria bacterium]